VFSLTAARRLRVADDHPEPARIDATL